MELTEQEIKDRNDPTTQEIDRRSWRSKKEVSKMVKEIIVKDMRYYLTRGELRVVKEQCEKRIEEFREEEIADASAFSDWKDSKTLFEFLGRRRGDK